MFKQHWPTSIFACKYGVCRIFNYFKVILYIDTYFSWCVFRFYSPWSNMNTLTTFIDHLLQFLDFSKNKCA